MKLKVFLLLNIFITTALLAASFILIEITLSSGEGISIKQHLSNLSWPFIKDHPFHAEETRDHWWLRTKPRATKPEVQYALDKSIVYDLDHWGFRVTPSNNDAKKHAIFLGCSMVFGDGIRDNETLPYHFAKKNKNFTPYNFAHSGASPSPILYFLNNNKLANFVNEKDGIIIFSFIDNHVNRALAAIDEYQNIAYHPLYKINGLNEVYMASKSVKQVDGALYYPKSIWSQTMTSKYFLKESHSEYEMNTFCSLMNSISNNLIENFPNSKIFLLKYPEISKLKIENCLSKDFKIIDLSNIPRPKKFNTHPDGFHPISEENEWLSEILINELNNYL